MIAIKLENDLPLTLPLTVKSLSSALEHGKARIIERPNIGTVVFEYYGWTVKTSNTITVFYERPVRLRASIVRACDVCGILLGVDDMYRVNGKHICKKCFDEAPEIALRQVGRLYGT